MSLWAAEWRAKSRSQSLAMRLGGRGRPPLHGLIEALKYVEFRELAQGVVGEISTVRATYDASDAKAAGGVLHLERLYQLPCTGVDIHAVNGRAETVCVDHKGRLAVFRDLDGTVVRLYTF